MLLSIKNIFITLRVMFIFLGLAFFGLILEQYNTIQYGKKIEFLEQQKLLLTQLSTLDSTQDPQVFTIQANGLITQINAFSTRLEKPTLLQKPLQEYFQIALDPALIQDLQQQHTHFNAVAAQWAQHPKRHHDDFQEAQLNYHKALQATLTMYLHLSIKTTKITQISTLLLALLGLIIFILTHRRLSLVYRDIDKVCAVDTDGSKLILKTKEMDFLLKRLIRRSAQSAVTSTPLLHPISGMNNDKGILSTFNTKKALKSKNPYFLILFELDSFTSKTQNFSPKEIEGVFKKVASIFSMYTKDADTTGHLENNRFVLILSRATTKIALDECEDILHSMEAATFNTPSGVISFTFSGGFVAKAVNKSIEETLQEAYSVLKQAQNSGGNRIIQFHERAQTV